VAHLVPDNLSSRKDVPEPIRRVARAFAVAADDDVIVWYEPLFDPTGRHPHLVVLEPRVGVVVLEVLSGRDPVDPSAPMGASPLARAEGLADNLRTALADHPTLAGVPVGAAAAFSGLDRDAAAERGLGEVVDLDVCLFKPDVDAAVSGDAPGGLLRMLGRAVGEPLDAELSDRQVDELRAVIHPDVVISQGPRKPVPASAPDLVPPPSPPPPDPVLVLDRRQETFAKSLGHGHRVIRGVAGSGKTLVLVHRARLLARAHPDRRILVTCYTRSLASRLRSQLAEHRNVVAVHLDRLMGQAIRRAGLRHPGYSGGGGPVARAALDAVGRARGPRYGAVMIDEAQDFDTDALRFCVALLDADDPDEQDLVVVADSAQNIFRRSFRWKDAGIRAQGRTRLLRVNYRNTREILDFAHRFLTADPAIPVDEVPDPEDELAVVPAESAERHGPPPGVVVAGDPADELRQVVATVRAAWPGSVAVLHGEPQRDRPLRPARLVAGLRAAGLPVFWVSDPDAPGNKDLAGSAAGAVVVSTIQSAKGLEFDDVVVCGLGARGGADLTTARKLLYVGFTRAVERLTVVVARSSPFHDDVLHAAGEGVAGP
jgi:hypothetical protein